MRELWVRVVRMKVLKALPLSVVFLSLFVWMGQARAVTNVSGMINQDTTWSLANSPYVVTGSVTVAAGVTLTIEAGVVVKFPGTSLYVDGTLLAQGTTSQPIVLTSYKDDLYVGDTNGDGTASSAAPGDLVWGDLERAQSQSWP